MSVWVIPNSNSSIKQLEIFLHTGDIMYVLPTSRTRTTLLTSPLSSCEDGCALLVKEWITFWFSSNITKIQSLNSVPYLILGKKSNKLHSYYSIFHVHFKHHTKLSIPHCFHYIFATCSLNFQFWNSWKCLILRGLTDKFMALNKESILGNLDIRLKKRGRDREKEQCTANET